MLAQNFKTAAELGITEAQKAALIKTLALLDGGKLKHHPDLPTGWSPGETFSGHFNMNWWSVPSECGTVCCIGGTAEMIGNVRFDPDERPRALSRLFFPNRDLTKKLAPYDSITPSQAAIALRSYLTTGDARWDLALAD